MKYYFYSRSSALSLNLLEAFSSDHVLINFDRCRDKCERVGVRCVPAIVHTNDATGSWLLSVQGQAAFVEQQQQPPQPQPREDKIELVEKDNSIMQKVQRLAKEREAMGASI